MIRDPNMTDAQLAMADDRDLFQVANKLCEAVNTLARFRSFMMLEVGTKAEYKFWETGDTICQAIDALKVFWHEYANRCGDAVKPRDGFHMIGWSLVPNEFDKASPLEKFRAAVDREAAKLKGGAK